LRAYVKNRGAVAGLIFLFVLVLSAALANYIFPGNPTTPSLTGSLLPPSMSHPFGTDYLGRDLLEIVVYGARVSLVVAFTAGGLLALIGTVSGLVAGYFGGLIDGTIMRTADVFLTLPTLPLVLVVAAMAGPSLPNILLIIALTGWPFMARIVRSNVLSMAQQEFIQVEKVMGASTGRILFKHLLPNQIGPILVYTSLSIPIVILTEAALEFLGLAPISIGWGFMLNIAVDYWIQGAWWMAIFPGCAIFSTCVAFYLISDGLKEVMTPTLKRKRESIVQLAGKK
jgi:peptide/nickel transport system permease protein